MTLTDRDRDFYRRVYRNGEDPWTEMDYLDRRVDSLLSDFVTPVQPQAHVLDLGCGRGRLTELAGRLLGEALGVDYLADPLRSARRHHRHPDVRYLCADAFQLPVEQDCFDVLLDYGLLHHVRDDGLNSYRRTVSRVLRPGGWYLGNVFHVEDRHADRGERDWVHHRGHYDRFFTLETLEATLGSDFVTRDRARFEDGDHVFLNVLLRREVSG